jgi:hypothetical protein
MPRLLLTLILSLLCALPAFAAEPISKFEPDGTSGVTPDFQRWHPEFEDIGDYGESWFYVARVDDGSTLFVMLSITNLGLSTFSASVDLQFYAMDGRKWNQHYEYDRDEISAAPDRQDITIGPCRTWGGGNAYHVTIDESDVKLDFHLANELPSYKFGSGKVLFYADQSAEYTLGVSAPRAVSSGSVTLDGQRFDLAGHGYHDHGWATLKTPSFIKRWYALRMFDEKYTLVLHRQFLQPKFGGGENNFGLLGVDDKIVGSTRNFWLNATEHRQEAGHQLPTELQILVNTSGYKVEGTVTELRYQESIDVLGRISFPVRMAIKAFYSDPWFLRYMGQCELDVTKDGVTEHVSHECLVEIDYY